MKIVAITIAAMSVCACAQMAPSHEIPAKQDHINAGIEAGDSVEITTKDGTYREFVVKDVGPNSIEGPAETIPFGEISKLVKRSWEAPTHPCAVGAPVGCSIPEIVLILSSDYAEQAEKFHPACVTHDFCYRHGYITYGVSREACDDTFYADVKKACAGPYGLDLLDIEQSAMCKLAADQTYNAIRRYGEPHYQTTTGRYCEYQ
jgi:hypothetical protein